MASTLTITDPKTISRIPLAYVDDVAEQLRADVLERARQQFGYRADTLAAQGPLGAALRQLDIAPLNEAEVKLYMQSKEQSWNGWKARGQVSAIVLTPALWLLIYFALCRWQHLPFFPWKEGATVDQGCGSFFGSMVSIMAGLGLAILMDKLPDVEYKRAWETWSLGPRHPETWISSSDGFTRRYSAVARRYPRFVPVHALETALQVQVLAPEAYFQVHELTLSVQHVKKSAPVQNPLPDPFLSVVLGSEEYFIAVWDERDYEVRA